MFVRSPRWSSAGVRQASPPASRSDSSAFALTVPQAGSLTESQAQGRTLVSTALTLELDHIFCMVSRHDDAASRLEEDGWLLDAGTRHAGQGTRNRRLARPEPYLELGVSGYADLFGSRAACRAMRQPESLTAVLGGG